MQIRVNNQASTLPPTEDVYGSLGSTTLIGRTIWCATRTPVAHIPQRSWQLHNNGPARHDPGRLLDIGERLSLDIGKWDGSDVGVAIGDPPFCVFPVRGPDTRFS
jgi:hypothetical protein